MQTQESKTPYVRLKKLKNAMSQSFERNFIPDVAYFFVFFVFLVMIFGEIMKIKPTFGDSNAHAKNKCGTLFQSLSAEIAKAQSTRIRLFNSITNKKINITQTALSVA